MVTWVLRPGFEFAVQCGVSTEGRGPAEIEAGFWQAMENRGGCCLWIVDDVPSGLSAEEMERAWNARWTGVRLCLPHGAENTVRLAAHSILGFCQPWKHSPCSVRIAGRQRGPSSAYSSAPARGRRGKGGPERQITRGLPGVAGNDIQVRGYDIPSISRREQRWRTFLGCSKSGEATNGKRNDSDYRIIVSLPSKAGDDGSRREIARFAVRR